MWSSRSCTTPVASKIMLLLLTLLTSLLDKCRAQLSVVCSMPEELPIGSLVCNLALKSGYEDAGGVFNIISINDYTYFSLEQGTSELKVQRRVDREGLVDQGRCSNSAYGTQGQGQGDAESTGCHLKLTVAYRTTIETADPKLIYVEVQITDINDHAPNFQTSLGNVLQKSIKEHDQNVVILLPPALDRDWGTNGSINYVFPESMKDNEFYQKFAIDNNSPTDGPSLRVIGNLDKEVTPGPFRLTVSARDGGQPPKEANLTILLDLIDTNDFPPAFEPLISNPVKVPESLARGSTVVQLKATDKDTSKDIRYALMPTEAAAGFRIRSNTGELYLERSLDAEQRTTYVLQVIASDEHRDQPLTATTSFTIQVIDVNDNAPEIQVVSFTNAQNIVVQENRPAPYSVALIKVWDIDVDLSNSQVYCNTAAFQSLTEDFKLEHVTGQNGGRQLEFKLVTLRPLNREQRSRYDLALTCQDKLEDSSGQAHSRTKLFVVNVGDENDNGPVFAQEVLAMRVRENEPLGTLIGRVKAVDSDSGENARVHYQLGAEYSSLVQVDRTNGQVRTRCVLDRELNSSVSFVVHAYDAARPQLNSTQRVILHVDDVNDNAPRFRESHYEFRVAENSSPHRLGRLIADDADEKRNAEVSYLLASVPLIRYQKLWQIQPDGTLMLRQRGLDRETLDHYYLVVHAYDRGTPSLTATTTVTILVLDENDCTPQFIFPNSSMNIVNVSTSEKQGSIVAQISAFDEDIAPNNQLTYTLTDRNFGCPKDLFDIDAKSGQVLLKDDIGKLNTAQLRSECRLVVEVKDQGRQPKFNRTVLRIHFTSRDSVQLSGGSGGGGRNDRSGLSDRDTSSSSGTASREIVIALGIGLTILVLCCVFLLFIYFFYYLQKNRCINCIQLGQRSSKSFVSGGAANLSASSDPYHLRNQSKKSNAAAAAAAGMISCGGVAGANSILRRTEAEAFLKSAGSPYLPQLTIDSGHSTFHSMKPDNTAAAAAKYYIADFRTDKHDDAVLYSKIESIDNCAEDAGYGCLQETKLDHNVANPYCVYEGNSGKAMTLQMQHSNLNYGNKSKNASVKRIFHGTMTGLPTVRAIPDNSISQQDESNFCTPDEVTRIFQSQPQINKLNEFNDNVNDCERKQSIDGLATVQRYAGYVYGSPYVTSSFV